MLGYAVWVLAQVLWGVQVTVPAHFYKISDKMLSMQSGVFANVLLWDGVWGALSGAGHGEGACLRD